jgi:hypothetical protein
MMRKHLNKRPSPAMAVALIALFIALSGTTYAATGGNFILGNPNTASSTSSLSAPVAGKALQINNLSTAPGATALGLNVASGHPPFATNSTTRVANLNADAVDGLDSSNLLQAIGGGVVRRHSDVLQPGIGQSVGLDGGFSIQYNCPATPTSSGAALISNNSGETIRLFKDAGGTNPAVAVVAQGGFSTQSTNPAGDAITFQTRRADGFMVSVWMFSVHRTSDCLWEFLAVTTP